MARWLVTRNDTQFAVGGLGELRELARAGRLAAGDMVQPPGTTGWLYASEIPELRDSLQPGADVVSDDGPGGRSGGSALNVIIGLVLVAAIGYGGTQIYQNYSSIPDPEHKADIRARLRFSEMVVTVPNALLRAEPKADAPQVAEAPKDSVLELLAKRGDFYKARDKGGKEGWIELRSVLPMYMLGGGEVRKEMDPLYNPDRYLDVANASWMQLPEAKDKKVTVFSFLLENESKYDMTDLVMVARIKDSKGHELDQVEFRVEGVVPGSSDTMVGTMVDPATKSKRLITQVSFAEMAAADQKLQLQYEEGVEVRMEREDFNEASIDIVEVRAVPKEGT